jgi:UDP-galactopyranose mutase
MTTDTQTNFDLVCFSHLRWDFVFQRPQHLMTRFARDRRVFFIEEPMWYDGPTRLDIQHKENGPYVCVPQIENGTPLETLSEVISTQIGFLLSAHESDRYVLWFYTPMMLTMADGLKPLAVVYDCMDELSAFRGAPPQLVEREQQLMARADLVFTGGHSLFEAKRSKHDAAYPFPSSVDVKHFGSAADIKDEVPDQQTIAHPRIGFAGVIDERLDIGLLDGIAELRPDWQFVMIGPVVKISEDDLPKRDNIHYLGMKSYDSLPAYLAGWDVAMMPFALNESTKYISPTKTPEYLSAGLPVVSTAITDVVRPYGEMGLVHIAGTPDEFVAGIAAAMQEDKETRMNQVAEFLAENSWDKTFDSMLQLIDDVIERREPTENTLDNNYAGPETTAIQGETIYV